MSQAAPLNKIRKSFSAKTISKRILNKYKTYEERTSFVFVGYFELYLKYNIKIEVNNVNDFFIFTEKFLNHMKKTYGDIVYERTLNNFNTLGYETIKNLYKKSDKDFITIIDSIIYSEITIENLMDMFEQLSPSDKSLNDFFTPPDISTLISKILIERIDTKKEELVIYDPTCGIVRLL